MGVSVRPDICTPVQLRSPGTEDTTGDVFKAPRKIITLLRHTRQEILTFVHLDLSAEIQVVIFDASFASAERTKLQLVHILLMAQASKTFNIVHFGSNKCKRIYRSVMDAEV